MAENISRGFVDEMGKYYVVERTQLSRDLSQSTICPCWLQRSASIILLLLSDYHSRNHLHNLLHLHLSHLLLIFPPCEDSSKIFPNSASHSLWLTLAYEYGGLKGRPACPAAW